MSEIQEHDAFTEEHDAERQAIYDYLAARLAAFVQMLSLLDPDCDGASSPRTERV